MLQARREAEEAMHKVRQLNAENLEALYQRDEALETCRYDMYDYNRARRVLQLELALEGLPRVPILMRALCAGSWMQRVSKSMLI